MSATLETVEKVADVNFAQDAIPLLKDFTNKFRGWSQEAMELLPKDVIPMPSLHFDTTHAGTARDLFLNRVKYMIAPAEELGRQVSAVIEQGRLKGLERVELWLRLAEFESELEGTKQILKRLTPKKS